MNKLGFALGMTMLAFSINVCAAQTKAPNEVTKTAAAAQSVQKVQLNSATLEQLIQIPGLGQKKAQAVLDYIAQHGPIKDAAQLTEVKGIGEKLAAKISPYMSFN
jgi:competence protein ComEA